MAKDSSVFAKNEVVKWSGEGREGNYRIASVNKTKKTANMRGLGSTKAKVPFKAIPWSELTHTDDRPQMSYERYRSMEDGGKMSKDEWYKGMEDKLGFKKFAERILKDSQFSRTTSMPKNEFKHNRNIARATIEDDFVFIDHSPKGLNYNQSGEMVHTFKDLGKLTEFLQREKIYANGGKMASGGLIYSVDIDLENGEQIRGSEVEFSDLSKAKELFNKLSKSGKYKGNEIENIQLLNVSKDFFDGYEVLESEFFAHGGGIDGQTFRSAVLWAQGDIEENYNYEDSDLNIQHDLMSDHTELYKAANKFGIQDEGDWREIYEVAFEEMGIENPPQFAKGGELKQRSKRRGDVGNRDKKSKVDTIKGDRYFEQIIYLDGKAVKESLLSIQGGIDAINDQIRKKIPYKDNPSSNKIKFDFFKPNEPHSMRNRTMSIYENDFWFEKGGKTRNLDEYDLTSEGGSKGFIDKSIKSSEGIIDVLNEHLKKPLLKGEKESNRDYIRMSISDLKREIAELKEERKKYAKGGKMADGGAFSLSEKERKEWGKVGAYIKERNKKLDDLDRKIGRLEAEYMDKYDTKEQKASKEAKALNKKIYALHSEYSNLSREADKLSYTEDYHKKRKSGKMASGGLFDSEGRRYNKKKGAFLTSEWFTGDLDFLNY